MHLRHNNHQQWSLSKKLNNNTRWKRRPVRNSRRLFLKLYKDRGKTPAVRTESNYFGVHLQQNLTCRQTFFYWRCCRREAPNSPPLHRHTHGPILVHSSLDLKTPRLPQHPFDTQPPVHSDQIADAVDHCLQPLTRTASTGPLLSYISYTHSTL